MKKLPFSLFLGALFFSSSVLGNVYFPVASDFLKGLVRQSQVELDNLKGTSLVTKEGENCYRYQFINPRSGSLEKELLQCAFIHYDLNRREERVWFSRDGVVFYTLSNILNNTQTTSNQSSIEDLLNLNFTFGDGVFSANDRFDIQTSKKGKAMILSSRYFSYQFSLLDQVIRGVRKISYERQCSWCSVPSQIEVQYHHLGLRYYSDQAPGLEVTPRLFQEALGRMYFQTVNWLSLELAYPLDQNPPVAIPRF